MFGLCILNRFTNQLHKPVLQFDYTDAFLRDQDEYNTKAKTTTLNIIHTRSNCSSL
jgi:hypothetical protein